MQQCLQDAKGLRSLLILFDEGRQNHRSEMIKLSGFVGICNYAMSTNASVNIDESGMEFLWTIKPLKLLKI